MSNLFLHPFRVLHLLTPAEIAELATVTVGFKKISLTGLINEKLDVFDQKQASDDHSATHTAKILPFEIPITQNEIEEIDKEEEEIVENNREEHLENAVDAKEQKKKHFFENIDDEGPREEPIDITDFILSQKKKLDISVKKMKEGQIINLYNKNKTEKKSNSKSKKGQTALSTGVLVNKKQA